ncbi:MAG: YHYH domain-containing protein [Pseudomonadota bacterium]
MVQNVVIAHGGRTDSSGCHNDRKSGTRHCH